MPVDFDIKPDFHSYANNWQQKPKIQVIEEVSSMCLESNGVSDPYHFIVTTDNKIISPITGSDIEEVIDVSTPIGRLEWQAFLKFKQQVSEHKSGAVVWISPPEKGVYPVSKVIISEIDSQGDIKTLFNRAMVLKLNEEKCLQFAQALAERSFYRQLLSTIDEVRSTTLYLDNIGLDWTYLFGELIAGEDELWESVRRGDDLEAKREVFAQAEQIYHSLANGREKVNMVRMIDRLQQAGMIGEDPTSCPKTMTVRISTRSSAFNAFYRSSRKVNKEASRSTRQNKNDPDYCIHCGACGEEINWVVRKGEACPGPGNENVEGCGEVRICT